MHALYGEIYEWCLEKYDEFGERMATKCIPLETFTYTQKAPRSRDRIIDVGTDLEHLQEALTKAREGLDFLTVTMIDSALITIEKYIWKLRSSR
jgi:DNA-binding ferritin-like protein